MKTHTVADFTVFREKFYSVKCILSRTSNL